MTEAVKQESSRPVCSSTANVLNTLNQIEKTNLSRFRDMNESWREKSKLYTNFQELVDVLKQHIKKPQVGVYDPEVIESVKSVLGNMCFNKKEWEQYQHFNKNKYTRNLVGYDENFTALMLCWNKGQRSPIHDHAGANCWVKVLTGTLTEKLYSSTVNAETGNLEMTKETHAGPGAVCYINDTYGLHSMNNDDHDNVCVSLHIYSPPFHQCNIYTLQGAPHRVSMVCANAPHPTGCSTAIVAQCPALPEKVPQPAPDSITLDEFVNALEKFDVSQGISDTMANDIGAVLRRVNLTPTEWQVFTHFSEYEYTRNLLYTDKQFSIILLCWMGGQKTPKHTHGEGRHAWFRVLCGELFHHNVIAGQTDILTPASTVFHEHEGLMMHEVGNHSKTDLAVSLHLYYPPYKEMLYSCDSSTDFHSIPIVCYNNLGRTLVTGGTLFTNFEALSRMLQKEFDSAEKSTLSCRLMDLLDRIQIQEQEYRIIGTWNAEDERRIILHHTQDFMMVLCCWRVGERSSIHDHANSSLWMKVLSGSVVDLGYTRTGDGLKVSRVQTLRQDCLSYIDADAVHSTHNPSVTSTACTLHVYSPPYSKCHCYNISGESSLVKLSISKDAPTA